MSSYKLLLADPKGRVVEHPWLLASLRSDESILPPRGRPIPLPTNAKLAHLPGRLPVGIDPNSGEPVLVKEFELDGKRFTPHAVGAVLPPGFSLTAERMTMSRNSPPIAPTTQGHLRRFLGGWAVQLGGGYCWVMAGLLR